MKKFNILVFHISLADICISYIHSEISTKAASFYDHPIGAPSFPAISHPCNETGRELNHRHSQTRLLAIRIN